MAENSNRDKPQFDSVRGLVEYFDTHDMSELLETAPEVHFDVDIQRSTYLIRIDPELALRLREIARQRHVSTEALVDSWLREQLNQAS
jgi:predicted HicB family RNase H-like nuclease